MRLNRFLSLAGVTSRRKADLLIKSGRVELNGKKVLSLATLVDAKKDKVKIDGSRVKLEEDFVYLLLNKPRGFLTTIRDDFKRPVVLDLIHGIKERIFPVGRLDYDTEGVLLLTNDGDLAYRLTHPRFQIPRVYTVQVKGEVTEPQMKNLRKGIKLEDGSKARGEPRVLKKGSGKTTVRLKLKEGKKREIKRIFKILGYQVEQLERISFAGVTTRDLKKGEWRPLLPAEVLNLKRMTGLKRNRSTG